MPPCSAEEWKPLEDRGRVDRAGGRPERTLGGGSIVLRGRLTPRTRHFGPVTSRTHQIPPYNRGHRFVLTQRGAV